MKLRQVMPNDDLSIVCGQITPEKWGKDNEMTQYDEALLREYLSDDKHVLLLAIDENNNDKIAGIALCYELPHPSKNYSSLYVHELDTHPNYRRQGISTSLMNELFKLAHERNISEVWVGTEQDNAVADAFYRHLHPSEIEHAYIYSYKIKA